MSSPNIDEQPGAPNCWQCRHFSVSWDPQAPYACRLMGFKSRLVPSIEVLRADGSRCRGFLPRPASEVSAPVAPAAVAPARTPAAAPSAPAGPYSTFSKLA